MRKVNQGKRGEVVRIKEELHDIFEVNCTLLSSLNLKKIFSLISRFTCQLTQADACTLRLVDKESKLLAVNSSYGFSEQLRKRLPVLRIGESLCGQAIKLKKVLPVYDLRRDRRVKDAGLLKKEGYRSILCLPIFLRQRALGVLSVFYKQKQWFTKEIIEILRIFACPIAMAIEETRHYENIHKNYFDTMHALVLAEETRDPYTRGHTERVTKYAISIGRSLNLSLSELEVLRYAGEVHDIGKISIPDFILGKPGKLTPAERAMIELHPVRGAELLEPLEFLKPALPAVRHHHERYDGTGYPDGLEKEKIPLLARILACADAFDAMTSDRPYRRRKLTTEEALAEIKNNVGSQFDPRVAHSFIHLLRSQK